MQADTVHCGAVCLNLHRAEHSFMLHLFRGKRKKNKIERQGLCSMLLKDGNRNLPSVCLTRPSVCDAGHTPRPPTQQLRHSTAV